MNEDEIAVPEGASLDTLPQVNYFINPFYFAQTGMDNYWDRRAQQEVSFY